MCSVPSARQIPRPKVRQTFLCSSVCSAVSPRSSKAGQTKGPASDRSGDRRRVGRGEPAAVAGPGRSIWPDIPSNSECQRVHTSYIEDPASYGVNTGKTADVPRDPAKSHRRTGHCQWLGLGPSRRGDDLEWCPPFGSAVARSRRTAVLEPQDVLDRLMDPTSTLLLWPKTPRLENLLH